MEIASYLVNPRSSVNSHVMHTIRRNLYKSALALDTRAKTFQVGISHRKGWLSTLEQPDEYALEVDLLDRDQVSLLSYYHDFDPERYGKLRAKLQKLVEQYLDAQDYSVGVVSSTADIVTEHGVLPRRWLQKIIPRFRGATVQIGGPSTIMSSPFSAEDTLERGESEYELSLVPRRSRADSRVWELACDITETVKEVRFETDVYPELAHHTRTYRAVQDCAFGMLVELFSQGAIVEDNEHRPFLRDWGFVQSAYNGVYLLSWKNRKITEPSGGPTLFAEKVQRETLSGSSEILIPYHCPDNDHSRHFLSRALLQLTYTAPLFQRDRVLIPTRSRHEAFVIASVVQMFALGAGGLRNVTKTIEAMQRINAKQPASFAAAEPDQKSIYLSLDSQNIYVYSLAEM